MSVSAAFPPAVPALLCAHQRLEQVPFDPTTVTLLRSTFDAVWREVANDVCETEDEQITTCNAVADAIVALAEAGLQPEQIKRLALSKFRFSLARKPLSASLQSQSARGMMAQTPEQMNSP